MRKQSGICIKSKKNRSIFLKSDGQFVKGTPVGNPAIGEEAFFYPLEKRPAIRILPTLAPITAAVAAIVLFMSALVFPVEEAYGYVQVQINPGVELGIDKDYKVISIRELNNDGRDLIHQMGDWENDSLSTVLNRVLHLAVKDETRDITITAVEEGNYKAEKTIKNIILALSLELENKQVAIQMKQATKEQWRHAKENQIPVGQMIKKAETVKNQVEPKEQLLQQEKQSIPLQVKEPKGMKEKKEETESKSKEPSNLRGEKKEDKSLKEKQPQNTPKQKSNSKESSNNPEKSTLIKPQKKVEPTKANSENKLIKKEEKDIEKEIKKDDKDLEKEVKKEEKEIQKDQKEIKVNKKEKKIEQKENKALKKDIQKGDSTKDSLSDIKGKERNKDQKEESHNSKSEEN
ncbi:hypothetical protein Plano_2063 [Planococcus sp. PAMC 21323]|uniref:anti-sigma-I factor RsgI family protein n=1 Tax=Planococcus sp. PAMC 21323 TaxID=1526927 RepID=UPI000571507E|nr:hypothetical protein [Planococcus sp. PAMC 21323]AIY06028.1 hypothetical protein Plano_2063 [Planococcus sp. PAMC 21323]